MEVALVRFIGAGLALVFEGLEEKVPAGAVAGADRFLALAASREAPIVLAAVERVTSEIWREWRIAKLPRPIAKDHLEALPRLLDRYRVPRSQMIGAVSVAQAARRTGSQAPGHAARVASTIVGELKAAEVFKSGKLNESIAYFFIDRLLSHLLKEPHLLIQLRDVFRAYVASGSWQATAASDDEANGVDAEAVEAVPTAGDVSEDVPRDGETGADMSLNADLDAKSSRESEDAIAASKAAEAVTRLAADYRIPEAALAALAGRAAAKGSDALRARLEEMAVGVRNLLALMAEPAHDPHDSETRSAGEEARAKLAAGDPGEADRLLANVESRLKRTAQADFGDAGALLSAAAGVAAQRGLLAELSFDWLQAAEQYGAAARYLPAADRKGRWRYLKSQAMAMERHGCEEEDTSSLVRAASIHSDAERLLSEQDAPAEWAQTYLHLGQLLLLLGEREARPERYLAATLHFKPALDVFTELGDQDNWGRAQWGLGEALRAQGEVQGDVEILTEAVTAYRAAVEVLTRDSAPDDWLDISFALGATLLRLGQESGDVEVLQDAAEVLEEVVATAQQADVGVRLGEMLAKRGHVLLALGAARGDLDLIAEAAQSLEYAIEYQREPLPEAATAAALDALGSALLVLAEAQNDVDGTLRAAEAKDAALAYYQSVGEEGLVESLTRELEEIVARLPDDAVGPASGVPA